jgi:hypothetical protein
MKLCRERKTEELGENLVPVPLRTPQISLELDQDRTRAIARL